MLYVVMLGLSQVMYVCLARSTWILATVLYNSRIFIIKTFSIWMTLLLFITVVVHCTTQCGIDPFFSTLAISWWTRNNV